MNGATLASIIYPEKFFEVRFQDLAAHPPCTSLCAGYDSGNWRSKEFAEHVFQWIPFAALTQEQQLSFGAHNFVEMLKIGAAHVYSTKKTARRGELGELLLHLACILEFGTVPILCKLVLKTSSNDTVKGFDGVHFLAKDNDVEIWLGESKFYTDGDGAIKEAVRSIADHILPDFLSTEKAMVLGHISEDIPNHDSVRQLFRSKTPKDKLLRMAVFPVLIAYESDSTKSFNEVCAEYEESLRMEIDGLRSEFSELTEAHKLRFQLIFVPMQSKTSVVEHFDIMLEAFK